MFPGMIRPGKAFDCEGQGITMKLSRKLRGGVCVFLLLCWLRATAQTTATISPPLTMQQAVELALRKNPTLLAAQQNLESIRAEEITAGLRQNPVFSLSGTDVSLPANNPSSPYSYAGNVSRLFERGQKRRWRLESARASTQVVHQHAAGQRGVATG
jgi:cobalt-zinc-cadmium efflux system outer membrane protein